MQRQEVDLWPDYERGKVGTTVNGERRFLDPERARAHAAILEQSSPEEIQQDSEFQRFLEDLRRLADEVDE